MTLFEYRSNYFNETVPCIYGNSNLRRPQIEAYLAVYKHFVVQEKKSDAVVVVPTGVGKTGIIGILPYGIAKGRVLVITPQIIIRETILDELDPSSPENFWLQRNVLKKVSDLPTVVELSDSSIKKEVIDAANIVILNIQKMQSRLLSSPLNFLPKDYFDMIIIDEAHHSVANTWIETLHHFSDAKVVKMTGTPIRTDKREISGELVYKYKLSQAMANNYVKSLRNFSYIPETLYLTIDGNENCRYTYEQILNLGIRDEDWISKSVALSRTCSESVVLESIKKLNEKLEGSKIPHKIIAVACNIEHAKLIKELYETEGYPTALLHSGMTQEEQKSQKMLIKTNKVKVVVNVAMLGEGYDHKYFSVAAIFRPFRSALPYAQFIGRILRYIPEGERPNDNIGDIISHHALGIDDLWETYKVEIQESEIIKYLSMIGEECESTRENTGVVQDHYNNDVGIASESESGRLTEDVYLTTELIAKNDKAEKESEKKIDELIRLLKITREQAKQIVKNADTVNEPITRPDLYFSDKKETIDNLIREQYVPDLLVSHSMDMHGIELKQCILFKNAKCSWISMKGKDNGAMLAMYFNAYLKNEFGSRKDWTIDDYESAGRKLDICVEYVRNILDDFLK